MFLYTLASLDSLDRTHRRIDSYRSKCEVHHLLNDLDNKLAVSGFTFYIDPDLFANEKEQYLGSLCKIHDTEEEPWYIFGWLCLRMGTSTRTLRFLEAVGRTL